MSEITEDSLMVASPEPARRRGRPRASEPGSTLSIWLPSSDHDYYAKLAAQRGESISKTVGLLLKTRWQQGVK